MNAVVTWHRLLLPMVVITAWGLAGPQPGNCQSAHALAGATDTGEWGALLTYQQVVTPPFPLLPAPVARPSFRGAFIGGLPGHGDLSLDGHVGGDPDGNVHGALRAGLRLSPHDISHLVRPAVTFSGGIRSVPNSPDMDEPWAVLATHPAVGLARIEALFEFAPETNPTTFVLRVRYETHWTHLVRHLHDGSGAVQHSPLLASQLIELRLGFLVCPQQPSSFFFESGFYVYSPFQPEERSEHIAVIVSAGMAVGGGGS